ncbi:MAG: DUF2173 family protein [Chromatiales bacterium]|nr:DUF2173 family protein [Chromatiales bacterium]
MELPGALASFHFSDRGQLGDYRVADGSPLEKNTLDMLCHMCVANTCIGTMQARGWEGLTGTKGFYPIEGFTLVGFEMSTVAVGNYGVVLRNEDADYQGAYDALAGQAS